VTKIGKLWTGAVAYVSLLVGAGLSVAGNLADTYRTRGDAVDTLDKVMAAGWPILVLLAIEMFVSPRWSSARMFQAWRWLGCLAVGGMAMVVSWTHLHDLMHSRGQLTAVSFLGPLAIDGMAIMATGLILSTRVRGHVTRPAMTPDEAQMRLNSLTAPDTDPVRLDLSADADRLVTEHTPAGWTGPTASVADVREAVRAYEGMPDTAKPVDDLVTEVNSCTWTPDTDISVTRPASELDAWTQGYEDALSTVGKQLADEAQAHLSAMSGPLPRRTRTASGTSLPQEFLDMVKAWDPAALSRADMVRLSAAHFDVSTRTIRRWLADSPTYVPDE